MRSDLEGKSSVAAAILAESLTVQRNGGRSHHAVEIDEHSSSIQSRRHPEVTPVQRNKLIFLVVEAMPRQQLVRMRNGDASEGGVVEARACAAGDVFLAVQPLVIQRENASLRGIRGGGGNSQF